MKSLKALMIAALLILGGNGARAQAPFLDVYRTVFWVDLGAVRGKQRAEAEWRRLQGKYAYLLGSAYPWFEEAKINDLGVFVRIVTGPFASRQTANAVCHEIIRRGDTCMVKMRR